MISIRKAEREDLGAFFALDRICFRPGIAYSKSELRHFLLHPHSLAFTAMDEAQQDDTKRIAGFAIVEWTLRIGRRTGHIITIDVHPEHRRQGVGHHLMQAMIAGLISVGAEAMQLEVAVDNEEAQEFYRRHGFVETGRIPGYYLGTLDAIAMERKLDAPASSTR